MPGGRPPCPAACEAGESSSSPRGPLQPSRMFPPPVSRWRSEGVVWGWGERERTTQKSQSSSRSHRLRSDLPFFSVPNFSLTWREATPGRSRKAQDHRAASGPVCRMRSFVHPPTDQEAPCHRCRASRPHRGREVCGSGPCASPELETRALQHDLPAAEGHWGGRAGPLRAGRTVHTRSRAAQASRQHARQGWNEAMKISTAFHIQKQKNKVERDEREARRERRLRGSIMDLGAEATLLAAGRGEGCRASLQGARPGVWGRFSNRAHHRSAHLRKALYTQVKRISCWVVTWDTFTPFGIASTFMAVHGATFYGVTPLPKVFSRK